jgi:hypothetical protein
MGKHSLVLQEELAVCDAGGIADLLEVVDSLQSDNPLLSLRTNTLCAANDS